MQPLRLSLLGVVAVLAAIALPAAAHAQPAPPRVTQVIDLGHVEVRAVPDEPPPPPPDPVAIKAGAAGAILSREVSFDEAQALVDFDILAPRWVPPGFERVQVQELGVGTLDNPSVILVYRDPGHDPRTAGPRELVIDQKRWAGIGPFYIPSAIAEGRIGDQPAAFWTRSFPAPALPAGVVERTFALWEHGELIVTMSAAGLSREEFIRVAESLATASP
jgi:hypothetical protein